MWLFGAAKCCRLETSLCVDFVLWSLFSVREALLLLVGMKLVTESPVLAIVGTDKYCCMRHGAQVPGMCVGF